MSTYLVCTGAPVNLTENIRPVRKLVNGSPALLDSLVFPDGAVPGVRVYDEQRGVWQTCALEEALDGRGFCTIELNEPPLAVNVRIGGKTSPPGAKPGSAAGSVLWHGHEKGNELVTASLPRTCR